MEVTLFRDIYETATPFFREPSVLLKRIKDGEDRALVERIRGLEDKNKRNEAKGKLPSICWSGKFGARNAASILKHSGIVCLDFDAVEDIKRLREKVEADPYTFASFLSPSGTGLKVLVKIPPVTADHRAHFEALSEHFAESTFDEKTSDVCRVCYSSFDPDIYVNNDSKQWRKKSAGGFFDAPSTGERTRPLIPVTDTGEIIRNLLVWWDREFGLKEGQRNHNAHVLAMAFNDYGIPKFEAEGVMMPMAHDGFPEKEIAKIIKSAYSKVANHGKESMEDRRTADSIRMAMAQGKPKGEIVKGLSKRMDAKSAAAAVDALVDNEPWHIFWGKRDTGKVYVIHHRYRMWLETCGFRRYYPEDSSFSVLVRVVDNIIDHTSTDKVRDHVLHYLTHEVEDIAVFEHVAASSKYFDEKYLGFLSPIEAHLYQDTDKDGMIYYENCALKVMGDTTEAIQYENMGGYVWRKHIVARKWNATSTAGGDFLRFVELVAGGNAQREKSLRSTLGYLMHGYKTSFGNRAVIINDQEVSDSPNGGSGKGLLCQAVGHVKRSVTLDGKAFSFDKSFVYQTVGSDTQLIVFDDIPNRFDFERLFSVITEGITLERKNKDAVRLPVERSPKIVITTNYTVGGVGGSFDRRRWEVELSGHFSASHTPVDEFGRILFGDWTEEEWAMFDHYMVECLQVFLNYGLVAGDFANIETKKLVKSTSHEFWEWCNDGALPPDVRHYRVDKYDAFTSEFSDYAPRGKYALTKKVFARWLTAWAKFNGWKATDGRDTTGARYTYYEVNTLEQPEQTEELKAPF